MPQGQVVPGEVSFLGLTKTRAVRYQRAVVHEQKSHWVSGKELAAYTQKVVK